MKNILLIEDDTNIANSLKEVLEKKDYRVQLAFQIQEATKLLNQYIDLIILDIQLPDGDGIDFCRQIRKQTTTPILF